MGAADAKLEEAAAGSEVHEVAAATEEHRAVCGASNTAGHTPQRRWFR